MTKSGVWMVVLTSKIPKLVCE